VRKGHDWGDVFMWCLCVCVVSVCLLCLYENGRGGWGRNYIRVRMCDEIRER